MEKSLHLPCIPLMEETERLFSCGIHPIRIRLSDKSMMNRGF
jgi:hypothetical protein